jgi:hypothetical protein
MAVRFFVVLLPVRDLLLVAKHLLVAAMAAIACRAGSRMSAQAHPGGETGVSCVLLFGCRFRTIQVCPKDLPASLRQVERAVDRPAPRREDARCPA